jgi:hypothetical protein
MRKSGDFNGSLADRVLPQSSRLDRLMVRRLGGFAFLFLIFGG